MLTRMMNPLHYKRVTLLNNVCNGENTQNISKITLFEYEKTEYSENMKILSTDTMKS